MIKKLVSIDCGYRNFATALAHVSECGTRAEIVKADVSDVLNGKRKRSNFLMVEAVVGHLRTLLESWEVRACDQPSFVCEQQVKGCNIPIGYAVMGFALGAFPQSKFVFMPAKKKFVGAEFSTAPNLKQAAIDECRRLIEQTKSNPESCRVKISDETRLKFLNLRKKDDISDCVLQVQSTLAQQQEKQQKNNGANKRVNEVRKGKASRCPEPHEQCVGGDEDSGDVV